MQTREASGPHGHAAAQTHPGLLHFGLGAAEPVELTITWPDAARTQTKIENPRRNVRMTVRQAEGHRAPPLPSGEGGSEGAG